MFQVTDSARDEINKVLATDAAQNNYLIIYFQGQGCAWPSLGMALDPNIKDLSTIANNGITAYIDPRLSAYLEGHGGLRIDYLVHEETGNAGYIIQTGNQADGTSCGGCSCS